MTQETGQRYAFFVTPHGYGHASRAAAVMVAIRQMQPGAEFDIFTRVPEWFFYMSLQGGYRYHEVLTDIGLVQATSMTENLPETVRSLDALLPYRQELIRSLADQVRTAGCKLVACDIAPMGIAVAREAGLPSVLVENFTWDWIYQSYLDQEPNLTPFIKYLREIFRSVEYHVRTEPASQEDVPAQLVSNVVWRRPRTSREETRANLGIPQESKLAMITMGGVHSPFPFLERLESAAGVHFLVPGGSQRYEQRGSLVLIPHHSDLYHPDLVQAADVIVGKLGYSTLAEAYASGIPYVYIPRANFPETAALSRFAKVLMHALELSEERYYTGEWLDVLPQLLTRPRLQQTGPNGADQIAEFLLALVK